MALPLVLGSLLQLETSGGDRPRAHQVQGLVVFQVNVINALVKRVKMGFLLRCIDLDELIWVYEGVNYAKHVLVAGLAQSRWLVLAYLHALINLALIPALVQML